MTNIYIIRHAEAEGNIYRRIDGHYNSRITAGGYKQIKALKERFADISIDAVYASDLFRTCETAKALYAPKGLELHKDARFRETYFGVWEDLHFGWLEHFEPEQYENFSHHPDDWRTPGAETAAEFSGRFIEGLTELAQKHIGQTIAVFTHGCVSGEAFRRLFGETAKKAGRCDNTGVSLLHYESGDFTPVFLNDNSHLSDEISTLAHQNWWRGKKDFNMWFRKAEDNDTSLFDDSFSSADTQNIMVGVLNEQPVGYVSYEISGDTVAVSRMYLIEPCRHMRMGDQLLGIPVVEARAKGCKRLTASVDKGNSEAIGFFTRMGAAVEQETETERIYTMQIDIPEY